MTDKEYRFYQRRLQLRTYCGDVYDWLNDVACQYKSIGEFPISLTDYYKVSMDVEISAIVEMILPVEHPNRVKAISEIHGLIGDDLSVMVERRNFIDLFLPGVTNPPILAKMCIYAIDIGNLLDWCWDAIYGNGEGIKEAVMGRTERFKLWNILDSTILLISFMLFGDMLN